MKTKHNFLMASLLIAVPLIVPTVLTTVYAQEFDVDSQQMTIANPFHNNDENSGLAISQEQKAIEYANPNLEKNLTKTDLKALDVAFDATDKSDNKITPVVGNNGKVVFQYGEGQNTIVCQVNQICVIELETNEMLVDGFVSDNTRWNIENSYVGTAESSKIMLLVRPKDNNLDSTFIITTDRRVYSLKLKSSYDRTMPFVSFSYPSSFDFGGNGGGNIATNNIDKLASKKIAMNNEIARNNAENARAKQAQANAAKARAFEREKLNTVYGSPTSNLDFNYKVSGNAHFKPVRVYALGHQTIIEFSPEIANKELPVLYSIKNKDKAIVNYRFVDSNKYVVDMVLDEAVLISGIGGKQQKISIRKSK